MAQTIDQTLGQEWVINLLDQPLLARIGTADPRTLQPHVVPVWFEWDGESIWISTFRSTRKIREIKHNPRVSIAIDTAHESEGVSAVILEGTAELITDPQVVAARSTTIYKRYLGEEGVKKPDPASWIVDPENMLIRLKPEKAFASRG